MLYVIVRRILLYTTSSGCKRELVAVPHEAMQYFRWQWTRPKHFIFKKSTDITFRIL